MTSPADHSPGPRTPPSVFGKSLPGHKVVGHVTCPGCGRDIAYALEHLGHLVQCPHCGRKSIRIGQSLVDETHPVRHAVLAKPAGVMVPRNSRLGRRMVRLILLGGAVGLVAIGAGALTASQRQDLLPGWLHWDSVAAREGKSPQGTAEPEAGGQAIPPEIALDAIEDLLSTANLQEALVQAQVWQQMLRDFGTPDTDPRLRRLAEVIDYLREQLRPKPTPPPAYIAEFRAALGDLREALIEENLSVARAALARAEEIFNAHPEELELFSRSFLALKQRFSQMELVQEGKQKIGDLLTAAEELIGQEQPTEAAESLAQAMFLALRTPMEEAEFQQRDETVRRLTKELRFIRGKRAVDEAEQCQSAGDQVARNVQLDLAFSLLPDLPADRVGGLLTRAKQLSEQTIENPQPSALGSELAYRAAYEEALNCYGRRNALEELAQRCVEARTLLDAAPSLGPEHAAKLADLILGALEFEVGDLLALPTRSPGVAPGLAMARTALEAASPFKETPRWRSVNRALQSKADEVASFALDQAVAQAAAGDLDGAVRTMAHVLTLAGGSLRAKAEGLNQQWQAEIARLARLAMEEDAWSEMSALYRQGRPIEVWHRLRVFEQQFPDSARMNQVTKIRESIRAQVDRAIPALLTQIAQWQASGQWESFRSGVAQLESAPLTPEIQTRLASFQETVAGMEQQAETLFYDLGRLKTMANDDDVVSLLAALDEILALHPAHEAALELQKRARTRAQQMAQYFLLKARATSTRSASYRTNLEKVMRLDPDGDSGREAKELLEKAGEGDGSANP